MPGTVQGVCCGFDLLAGERNSRIEKGNLSCLSVNIDGRRRAIYYNHWQFQTNTSSKPWLVEWRMYSQKRSSGRETQGLPIPSEAQNLKNTDNLYCAVSCFMLRPATKWGWIHENPQFTSPWYVLTSTDLQIGHHPPKTTASDIEISDTG
jgi:hypothetical protein